MFLFGKRLVLVANGSDMDMHVARYEVMMKLDSSTKMRKLKLTFIYFYNDDRRIHSVCRILSSYGVTLI